MRVLVSIYLITIGLLFVGDAKSAAIKPKSCEPCSNNDDIFYVESEYFDMKNLTKPIDNFQEKLNIMIHYIVVDDGNSRSSNPSGPVSLYSKRVSS